MSQKPNIVYVGSKPPMNYVMALMQGISMSDTGEVILKAREGRSQRQWMWRRSPEGDS